MADNPLAPLSVGEVSRAAAAVRSAAVLRGLASVRFNTVTLAEPPKASLLAHAKGGPLPPRRALVVLLNTPSPDVHEIVVDLGAGEADAAAVASWAVLDAASLGGQPPATPDDCLQAEAIARNDPGVAALLAERGVALEHLFLDPWAVHNMPEWKGGRMMQVFCYVRTSTSDNEYAHPLDLVPLVDLLQGKVVAIEKFAHPPPVPMGDNGNYHRASQPLPWRTGLKPLHVVQPEGPSFSVDGWRVAWQHWTFRLGFNAREGLVLYDVAYEDVQEGGRVRPVVHRASIVEMAVPYGDPVMPFNRKCALDAGDYGLGFAANSLALGCDCLGTIRYFDAVVNDAAGEPVVIKNAVCLHEEDGGLLWKHQDYRTGATESRRNRRLVVSFIMTAVNYEYAFYWSFGLDGSISHEVKLTGLLATGQPHAAEAASDPPYGTLVAPGVNAQHHQHFFCARLDMAVDDAAAGGAGLVVSEVEAVADAPAPGGANNGFVAAETPLASVHAAMRRTSPATGRFWKVSNPAAVHRVTRKPVAYALIPGKCAAMMADAADSAVARRAHFVTRNLWVTPHDDGQLYPAGTYCMQSERCTGLKVWTAEDVALAGRDPVLWYCFGITHLVRPEDWPVMPCESTGFTLKPWGFFHVNPSVTIPPSVDAASALHTGDGAAAAAAPGVACH